MYNRIILCIYYIIQHDPLITNLCDLNLNWQVPKTNLSDV